LRGGVSQLDVGRRCAQGPSARWLMPVVLLCDRSNSSMVVAPRSARREGVVAGWGVQVGSCRMLACGGAWGAEMSGLLVGAAVNPMGGGRYDAQAGLCAGCGSAVSACVGRGGE